MPSPALRPAGVQGNILKAFGRDHAVYLFIRFDNAGVRPDLQRVLNTFVTPADVQVATTHSRTRDRTISEGRGEAFDQPGIGVGMFGLSASGYKRLGLDHSIPSQSASSFDPFRKGMKAGTTDYSWDPRPQFWEPNYGGEIDAFLLLAHDSPTQLAAAEARAKTALDSIGEIVAQERGGRLRRRQQDRDIEHFGFSDGVAQAPDPKEVFSPEVSPGAGGVPAYGSFAVFLKIEQNVLEFERVTEDLARKAETQQVTVNAEEIRERVIGRKRNGDPLVPFNNGDPNDFTFVGEQDDKCPFHAHVRMMNPRDGRESPPIVRRGMTYGTRRDLATAGRQLPPSAGVGLLFLSFQRSLGDFLSLMQRARTYRDPLLSHKSDWHPGFIIDGIACTDAGTPGQSWRLGGKNICYPVADLTTVRGGEYFYIPSIDFINGL